MNEKVELDRTDLELIDFLNRDGRGTLASMSAAVGLSAPAVKRRVERLEALKVITGYKAAVDHAKLGRPIEAFAEISFAGSMKIGSIAELVDGLPEIDAVHVLAGDPDALIHLRVRGLDDLTRVIDLLRGTGKVTRTKTLIVLGNHSTDP